MRNPILTGGCYCGDIRYRIESEILRSIVCHCPTCARTAGAHTVAWLTVPSDGIVLVSGEPMRRTSGTTTRTFCGRCGTKLSYRDDARSETDVTVSSIDRFHGFPSPVAVSVDNDDAHSETRIEMTSNAE